MKRPTRSRAPRGSEGRPQSGGDAFQPFDFRRLHDPWMELMARGVRRHLVRARSYFTGYENGTLFDWDLYFESILQLYAGWPTYYARNGILLFLDQQREDG